MIILRLILRSCSHGILVGALLLGLPCAALSQLPPREIGQAGRPAIKVYTDHDGLPQNTVEAITVDQRGYLWVGTQDGAARYNGRNWTQIALPGGTQSGWIKSILSASDGALWFGQSHGGIATYRNGTWQSHSIAKGVSGQVRCLAERKDGTILAGTDQGGFHYDGHTWSPLLDPGGRATGSVLTLREVLGADGETVLWLGTERGIAAAGPKGAWRWFTTREGLPANEVSALLDTREPNGKALLWAGTARGLARWDGHRWKTYGTAEGLPANAVNRIIETASPNGGRTLWLATDEGLAHSEGDHWRILEVPDGFPNRAVRSLWIEEAPGGHRTIWAGTFGGLVRLSGSGWTTFDRKVGLPDNTIFAILESKLGTGFWMAAQGGGLAHFQQGQWTTYGSESRIPDRNILALLETRSAKGTPVLWAGSRGGGVLRQEDGQVTRSLEAQGLPDPNVYKLAEIRNSFGQQEVWAGTRKGVARWRGGRWEWPEGAQNLAWSSVLSIEQGAAPGGGEGVWVATRGNGIYLSRDGKWTHYDTGNGLPDDRVLCLQLIKDAQQIPWIWAGSLGGLCRRRLDRVDSAWEPVADLPSRVIYSVLQDRSGRVYAFTHRGVCQLSPLKPTAADPRPFSLRTFTTGDGLPSNGCTQNSAILDSRGRIWTGTVAGAALYDPGAEAPDRLSKPFHFERIRAGQGFVDELRHFTVDWRKPSATFEFALLNYYREEDTRYRSQLEGLETEPSAWTRDGKREYPLIPQGSYTFKAWALDAAGNASGPLVITFRVLPSPWQSWWARLLYVLGGATLIGVVIWARVRALRARNSELERKVQLRTRELAEAMGELETARYRTVKTNEALRSATEAAQEANQAKSQFLASMSHELRTPLNAILGFTQILRRNRSLPEEDRNFLERILRAGEHLLGLINDVLSISKIEAGKISLNPAPFNLRILVMGIEELIAVRAGEKGLELQTHFAEEVAEAFLGDEGKLRQVLINLLGNAVKFTPAGRVDLWVEQRGEQVRFTVKDTGPGLSPEEITELFEAFQQTASGRKAREGTGLGLFISQAVVRLMGGAITVDSTPGQGSTFRFELPLKSLEASAAPLSEFRMVAGLVEEQLGLKALVVDDRLDNRELLAILLTQWGFEVRMAEDGQAGLETWAAWAPDVIWMDLVMPRMSGQEAVTRIRAQERASGTQRTWIFALSASVLGTDQQALLDQGFDAFLPKPFHEAQIADAMERVAGVRFRTESGPAGPKAGLAAEALRALPQAWCDAFRETLLLGDLDGALGCIDRLGEQPLTQSLKAHVADYRFEELLHLLDGRRDAHE